MDGVLADNNIHSSVMVAAYEAYTTLALVGKHVREPSHYDHETPCFSC